jgi:hypothetical protein
MKVPDSIVSPSVKVQAMPLCRNLAILFSMVATIGCDRAPSDTYGAETSASASATTDASGNIVSAKPTADQVVRISDVTARTNAVNLRFPPGSPPVDTPPNKGSRMLPTGELVLDDGRIITLDGVWCTRKGYEYLSRFFLEPSASLLVVETGSAAEGRVPAEVWVLESLGSGMSAFFPVEAGISTGWCDARRSDTSPHNDRFAALETAFSAERTAFKSSAP